MDTDQDSHEFLASPMCIEDSVDPVRYMTIGRDGEIDPLVAEGMQASLVDKIDAGAQLVYALYHVHGEEQLAWLKAAPLPVHRALARAQSAYGVGRVSPHAGLHYKTTEEGRVDWGSARITVDQEKGDESRG